MNDFLKSRKRAQSETNPRNEPTGHFTGRCGNCGSSNLWDDNANYGCNNCKRSWGADQTGGPRLVRDNSNRR